MREGLMNEIKEYLATEEKVDVTNFGLVGIDGLELAVCADETVFVFEFDMFWEEATLVCEYPLSMISNREGI